MWNRKNASCMQLRAQIVQYCHDSIDNHTTQSCKLLTLQTCHPKLVYPEQIQVWKVKVSSFTALTHYLFQIPNHLNEWAVTVNIDLTPYWVVSSSVVVIQGYSGSYSVYHTKLNTSPKFSCDVIDSFLLNSDLLEQKINILKSSGYNTEV